MVVIVELLCGIQGRREKKRGEHQQYENLLHLCR
jgi:hypothetical protein